ncbi:MAG TPA: ABC transporter permease, partial [Rhodospirillales bacterium]|nr:ABC transporter permease [Rhodospirillales bacterium]
MNGYLALSYLDVALAALFVLLTAALSWAARLGLERRLLLVSLRMVLQLALVGLVLKALFSL